MKTTITTVQSPSFVYHYPVNGRVKLVRKIGRADHLRKLESAFARKPQKPRLEINQLETFFSPPVRPSSPFALQLSKRNAGFLATVSTSTRHIAFDSPTIKYGLGKIPATVTTPSGSDSTLAFAGIESLTGVAQSAVHLRLAETKRIECEHSIRNFKKAIKKTGAVPIKNQARYMRCKADLRDAKTAIRWESIKLFRYASSSYSGLLSSFRVLGGTVLKPALEFMSHLFGSPISFIAAFVSLRSLVSAHSSYCKANATCRKLDRTKESQHDAILQDIVESLRVKQSPQHHLRLRTVSALDVLGYSLSGSGSALFIAAQFGVAFTGMALVTSAAIWGGLAISGLAATYAFVATGIKFKKWQACSRIKNQAVLQLASSAPEKINHANRTLIRHSREYALISLLHILKEKPTYSRDLRKQAERFCLKFMDPENLCAILNADQKTDAIQLMRRKFNLGQKQNFRFLASV